MQLYFLCCLIIITIENFTLNQTLSCFQFAEIMFGTREKIKAHAFYVNISFYFKKIPTVV